MSAPERVYFFATCLIDLLYPKAGLAGMQLIRRAGVEVVFPEAVHQKTDVSQFHSINRQTGRQEAVQCTQHESVTTQRDDHVRLANFTLPVTLLQLCHRATRGVRLAGYKMYFPVSFHCCVL